MKRRFCRRTAVVAGALLTICGATAGAVDFTSSFTGDGNWNRVYAQGFSAGLANNFAPGAATGSTVNLKQFQFFRSGLVDTGGGGVDATNVRLAITSPFFVDLSTLTTASTNLRGLSTNTIATTATYTANQPIVFNFNNIPIVYGRGTFDPVTGSPFLDQQGFPAPESPSYAAIFVNVGTTNIGTEQDPAYQLTPVLAPVMIVNASDNPPGSGTNYHPTHDYGHQTQDYFDAVSNYINGNYFATFNQSYGYADADFVATYSATPVKGDFDRNGVVSVADVQAMMTALTDLSGYSATNHLSLPDDLVQLGDFDSDMKVTNLDLQGLLNLLANNSGGGSMSAVPEPTSVALICIGGLLVFGLRKRESG